MMQVWDEIEKEITKEKKVKLVVKIPLDKIKGFFKRRIRKWLKGY